MLEQYQLGVIQQGGLPGITAPTTSSTVAASSVPQSSGTGGRASREAGVSNGAGGGNGGNGAGGGSGYNSGPEFGHAVMTGLDATQSLHVDLLVSASQH